MEDFNVTLFETCELLNKSKRSVSRYVRRGLLCPKMVKSLKGTLEYRFRKEDIEMFKAQGWAEDKTRQDTEDKTRQDTEDKTRQDTEDKTRQDTEDKTRQDTEIINILKETTTFLKDQLKAKDEQIKDLGGKIDELIQRDRETNILLRGLQDKVFALQQGQEKSEPITAETDQPLDSK